MYGVGMYCCCCRLPCVWVVAGRAMFGRNQSGKSGCYSLGWYSLAWAGLGWYSLGWAGLGWAGLVVDRVDTQWWCRPSLCRGGSIHLAGGGGGGRVTTTQAGLCHGYADIYTYLHSLHIYTLYIYIHISAHCISTQCIYLLYLHRSTKYLHCSIFR